MTKYKEYKKLDFPAFEDEILKFWEENKIFQKSVSNREGAESFVFYEGPPSANGMPGIHHVMARTVKDIFCRYQTLNGKQVKRKAGWDTHGLPVELQVEKMLGITKDDIGKKISVAEYNEACRKDVMKYTDIWDKLTNRMGYWVDLSDPYITYENNYIESLWWLLKQLYDKKLLYKGYTIQPYSPAAGTGLSSHELNQPGTYKDVKDMTAVAMFKAVRSLESTVHSFGSDDVYFIAWTTTPWTLPSNTALAVGEKITYAVVKTYNQYSHLPCTVILAKDLMGKYFPAENAELDFNSYTAGDKKIPFTILGEVKGKDLAGIRYDQLLPFKGANDNQFINGDAFKVITGDFVTTEDGTGIVHIAPSFGADDFRVAKQNGIVSLTLVDKRGKFLHEVQDGQFLYGQEYVKEAYLTDAEKESELAVQKEKLKGVIHDTSKLNYLSVDERIILKLQTENKLFKKEKYEHTYPHCWRTDKPILYYPLESWFIKTTAAKDRLVDLNKTINWKPEHTGTGRFGNWLENLVDWNLSRSRYWGTPLPIWRAIDGSEEKCIGSQDELQAEIAKAIEAGFMSESDQYRNAKGEIELHKPYVDNIKLISSSGKLMVREPDLIDEISFMLST
jgi:isoleucyl-tRNA synthetase